MFHNNSFSLFLFSFSPPSRPLICNEKVLFAESTKINKVASSLFLFLSLSFDFIISPFYFLSPLLFFPFFLSLYFIFSISYFIFKAVSEFIVFSEELSVRNGDEQNLFDRVFFFLSSFHFSFFFVLSFLYLNLISSFLPFFLFLFSFSFSFSFLSSRLVC